MKKNIPLFEQTIQYVHSIEVSIPKNSFSRPAKRRLINLIHKYDESVYKREEHRYSKNPDQYLKEEDLREQPFMAVSFLREKLSSAMLFKLIVKVFAHYIFRSVGFFQQLRINNPSVQVVRRSYVDDVEALFDDEGMRLVYPFPLSIFRQIKYLKYLHLNSIPSLLTGLPYRISDLKKVLCNRDFDSFQRMEKNAQTLHAIEMGKYMNLKVVQCSDEYDIGSIDFCRYMQRKGVRVHNSAHGVSKYLPYHFYDTFDVLTEAQKTFYEFFNQKECNVRTIKKNNQNIFRYKGDCAIVFLGQLSDASPLAVSRGEREVLEVLETLAKLKPKVDAFYKKHPNCQSGILDSSSRLQYLSANIMCPADRVLQLSLYSTCQIDPNFIGKKILVETDLIRPRIIFGDNVVVVKSSELLNFLTEWVDAQ